MWKFGGTYSDTDIFCNSKLPNDKMILALERPNSINVNFLKTTQSNQELYFKAMEMFNERYMVRQDSIISNFFHAVI